MVHPVKRPQPGGLAFRVGFHESMCANLGSCMRAQHIIFDLKFKEILIAFVYFCCAAARIAKISIHECMCTYIHARTHAHIHHHTHEHSHTHTRMHARTFIVSRMSCPVSSTAFTCTKPKSYALQPSARPCSVSLPLLLLAVPVSSRRCLSSPL